MAPSLLQTVKSKVKEFFRKDQQAPPESNKPSHAPAPHTGTSARTERGAGYPYIRENGLRPTEYRQTATQTAHNTQPRYPGREQHRDCSWYR